MDGPCSLRTASLHATLKMKMFCSCAEEPQVQGYLEDFWLADSSIFGAVRGRSGAVACHLISDVRDSLERL